jgi:2-C-methyl-D-erythritol 2,4-cyclodiphosphate synthase
MGIMATTLSVRASVTTTTSSSSKTRASGRGINSKNTNTTTTKRNHNHHTTNTNYNRQSVVWLTTTRAESTQQQEQEQEQQQREAPVLPFRVGHGFDLHRLESTKEFPELKLILAGIEIPHDRGCVAHSDGDVLLHCVVDAITGALGLPDIGQLFPDSDPKWKGQTSDVFVIEAIRLMKLAGYELGNIDCTLIAERPKISPHKEKIKKNLAKLLGVHESCVNVKAKTHEKVDSLGENRSIACHTVVMLIKA